MFRFSVILLLMLVSFFRLDIVSGKVMLLGRLDVVLLIVLLLLNLVFVLLMMVKKCWGCELEMLLLFSSCFVLMVM